MPRKKQLPKLNHKYYQTITPVSKRPVKILEYVSGNFSRGLINWMIDKINWEAGFNGNCTMVNVDPDNNDCARINSQDGLYTLYLSGYKNGNLVKEHFLIDSIEKCLDLNADFSSFLGESANGDLRFFISDSGKDGIQFDVEDEPEDLAKSTFPAQLTTFLFERFKHFNGDMSKGLIILPCEQVEQNGDKLLKLVLQYSEIWDLDDDFKEWLEQANSFCNTYVDRIVQTKSENALLDVCERLGYQDDLLLEGEQYYLWVISGPDFVKEELPLDKAGLNIIYSDNLKAYFELKKKIYVALVLLFAQEGIERKLEFISDVVEDDDLLKNTQTVMFDVIFEEIQFKNEEIKSYYFESVERIKNPYFKIKCVDAILENNQDIPSITIPLALRYIYKSSDVAEPLLSLLLKHFYFESMVDESGEMALLKSYRTANIENIKQYLLNHSNPDHSAEVVEQLAEKLLELNESKVALLD